MREALNILWVDDNLRMISYATELFERRGFRITPAANAGEALRSISSSTFDLLLIDLELEDEIDGTELASEVRKRDDQIPIFILSAHIYNPIYSSRLDRLKLSGLIDKPLPPTDKGWQELCLKLELACQEADFARLQRKYGLVMVNTLMESLTTGKECFVISPFKEEFNAIYDDIIVSVLSQRGIKHARADEIYGVSPIIEDIENSIAGADFVIAELTERNPNVLYELGLAHAMKKPVILITQSMNDIPFDLKHRRCIVYSPDHRGVRGLEDALSKTVDAVVRSLPLKIDA